MGYKKSNKGKKSRADQLLDEILSVMTRYSDIPEAEMYEYLITESEGWKMRLEELERDQEGK